MFGERNFVFDLDGSDSEFRVFADTYGKEEGEGVPVREQIFEGSEIEILESAAVFESAGHAKVALYQAKAGGMSAVLEWIGGNDFTYDTLDAIVAGVADVDFNKEITGDEEALFNQVFGFVADVLVRAFLSASFSGEERHQRRLDKVMGIEAAS